MTKLHAGRAFTRLILLALCLQFSNLHAEPLSVTFIDKEGDTFIDPINGVDGGDIIEGRIFFGEALAPLDFEFESAPNNPFFNNGQFLALGGTALNLDNPANAVAAPGTLASSLMAPQRFLTICCTFGLPVVDFWQVGDKVAVHRAYGFEAADIDLPASLNCVSCSWLFGVNTFTVEGFADEFETPFSSFGIASRHPRAMTFGFLERDDTGQDLNGILYFRIGDFLGAAATATGPLVSAIENRFGNPQDHQEDSLRNLIIETSTGTAGQTTDKDGLIALVGFPFQSYPDNRAGPFSEFFVQPRDLTDARIGIKLTELSNTGLVEARMVAKDVSGSLLATQAMPLTGTELYWRMRFSDFSELVSGANFDPAQVVDFWVELFASAPVPDPAPATEILINRVDIEVRQPKVRLVAEDPVLRFGESTRLSWQSAEAQSCTGTGLLAATLPTSGSVIVSDVGQASISCTAANSQTFAATDSVTIRRASRSVLFADPAGDATGSTDIRSLRLDVAENGWYQVSAETGASAMFPEGPVAVSVRFYNGDVDTYDVASAVLLGENGAPGNLRTRRAYLSNPTQKLVLSGRAPKLIDWKTGDRIALDTSVFGNPNVGDIERTSLLFHGGNDVSNFFDSFTAGLVSRLGNAPIGYVAAIADVNANGVEDIALLRQGSITAEIRDGQTGTLLRIMSFLGSDFDPAGITSFPDADGDGNAELAVLATRISDGRIAVEIRNVAGAEAPRTIWFAPGHAAIGMAAISSDADMNGVPELAVLSRRNSDGRGLVEVKNAFGATNPRALWAGAGLTPIDVDVLDDADGNGVAEVAILSTRNSDGRIVAEVKNAAGATMPHAVWFAPGHSPVDLVVVNDKDANGIPELALLSSRDSDGRVLVETKNASGNTLPSTVWFAPGHTALSLMPINDADGNGIPEIAVLSTRNSDGRILVEVKNVAGASNPHPIWYSPGFAANGMAVLNDVDNSGAEEIAVLLIRNGDGRILVQGRNAAGSTVQMDYWISP